MSLISRIKAAIEGPEVMTLNQSFTKQLHFKRRMRNVHNQAIKDKYNEEISKIKLTIQP
jgi:hypothetical protein